MKNLQLFLSQHGSVTTGFGDSFISVLSSSQLALVVNDNKEFVDRLVSRLQVVAAESFGKEFERQSSDGVRNHITGVDGLALLHKNDGVLGFASSKIFLEDGCFYLHGACVGPSFKGKGVSIALVKALWDLTSLPKIAFTTQSPIMFCLLKGLCAGVYPSPESRIVPEDLHNLGARLVKDRQGELDTSTFVIRELYQDCLYKTIPECRDSSVNRWFNEALQIDGGVTRDGFLFVGDRKQ